ncbi:MAG: hypothetical protein HOU01_26165 [Streptomycetaceae bacterium]|nr:hypothetical protein [Streptomycetaceae bacterium]
MSAIPVGTSEPDTGAAGPAVPPAAVDAPTDAGESLPGRESSSPVPPTVADVVVFTPPPALFRGEDGPGADDEAPPHEAAPSWRPPTPSEDPPRGT